MSVRRSTTRPYIRSCALERAMSDGGQADGFGPSDCGLARGAALTFHSRTALTRCVTQWVT